MKTIVLGLSAALLTVALSAPSLAQTKSPASKIKVVAKAKRPVTKSVKVVKVTAVKAATLPVSAPVATPVVAVTAAPVATSVVAETVAQAVTPVASMTTATVATAIQAAPDTSAAVFDKALAAQAQGDKAATAQALEKSATALETEAQTTNSSFKDKLLSQAGILKKLAPLAQSGFLSSGVLQKALSLAKMAFAANKVESLLGGGSLLSGLGGLTSNLNLLKGGLSGLGGGSSQAGGSLIDSALGGLSSLGQGGAAATAAEPAVRGQLTNVLGFVKNLM